MSGVSVIHYLAQNNATLIAVFTAGGIIAGDLPQGTLRPALAVTSVSGNPFNHLDPNEAEKLHTERVRASWIFDGPADGGAGYPGAIAAGRLVAVAFPNRRGLVNGIKVDSIVLDVAGPDVFDSPTDMYAGSRDFIVKWVAVSVRQIEDSLGNPIGTRYEEDGVTIRTYEVMT